MEFLLLWVLSGNFVDSGLRYEDAGSCYAEAQNTGMEMSNVQSSCCPLNALCFALFS